MPETCSGGTPASPSVEAAKSVRLPDDQGSAGEDPCVDDRMHMSRVDRVTQDVRDHLTVRPSPHELPGFEPVRRRTPSWTCAYELINTPCVVPTRSNVSKIAHDARTSSSGSSTTSGLSTKISRGYRHAELSSTSLLKLSLEESLAKDVEFSFGHRSL